MTDTKRLYSKQNPIKDLLPSTTKKKVVEDVIPKLVSVANVTSYVKPSKELLPKAFFVIISGGEVRERDYFRVVSNQDRFKRIKIDFIADPNKLNPCGLLSIALIKKELYRSSQDDNTENPDRIFIVSDVDLFMPELIKIKPECEKEGLGLIISNSCFEVWLFYAYNSDVPKFPIPEEVETISWKFKKWLPRIIKGGVNPVKSIFNIQSNIENAKANYRVDGNGIPILFSTNMFQLAEILLPLIEPELKRMVEDNRIREGEYRNNHKHKRI